MKDVIKETLAFEELTPEEKEKRHILGRLYGPIADIVNPTRNGRKYSEQLWEQVFENPIMKEKFNNKVMYGELGHPEDRTEIDMSKIAICMPEPPKKDKEGHLIGYFDILDTPNGRILKTLCDYGSTLGISSRGTGDVIDMGDGEEVDPDTYDCECWDIVLIPAVESARLTFTEGLSKKSENNVLKLKKALCEDLNKATADDKVIMQEALNNLGLSVEETNESISEKSVDIETTKSETNEQTPDESKEAINEGSEDLIKSLQESIKEKAELEAKIKSLQEKLAVSDAKAVKLEEEVSRNRSTIIRLTTIAKDSKAKTEKISTLEEELKVTRQTIEQLEKTPKTTVVNESVAPLKEKLVAKDGEIKSLTEQLETLKGESDKKITALTEELEQVKSDSTKQLGEMSSKVKRAQKIAEGYKKIATDTVDKYIETKALMLGVKVDVIMNKLSESYDVAEIDKVCEELMNYELNYKKLPFKVDRNAVVKVTESKNPSVVNKINDDDFVDEDSFMMAGLRK